jgi:DNA primase
MKYTSEQLTQINNAIPIVEYVSKYLKLEPGTGRRSNEYWTHCCFHEGDNNSSLSFNSDKNVFRCMACDTKGGLINFVMEYHNKSFVQAIEYILQLVNIPFEEREYSEIVEYLHKTNHKIIEKEVINRVFLPESTIYQYTKEPIIEWINEGIQQDILDKYNVRYDKKGNAIIFPIRDINGNIIAIKARTRYENHADLGIPKYMYYQKIITNDFLFGLYENIEQIKKRNEVIIFEGCKSVMLAEGYDYPNCVSLETNNFNEYQINLLLQLKCNIVIALDKGMKITNQQGLKNTKDTTYINIGLLPKFTNVEVIEDRYGLLPPKASPVDCGKEVFDKLYEGKYKI